MTGKTLVMMTIPLDVRENKIVILFQLIMVGETLMLQQNKQYYWRHHH